MGAGIHISYTVGETDWSRGWDKQKVETEKITVEGASICPHFFGVYV